jgi:hypothetical protein
MIPKTTDTLLGTLELDIGVFQFYPSMVISEMKEGVVVNFDNCLPIFVKGLEYYTQETPLVYISNRINSYSFDPTLHLEAKTVFSNLRGYGVVIYDEMNMRIAQLEQKFLDCPHSVFNSLDDAKSWALTILNKK